MSGGVRTLGQLNGLWDEESVIQASFSRRNDYKRVREF